MDELVKFTVKGEIHELWTPDVNPAIGLAWTLTLSVFIENPIHPFASVTFNEIKNTPGVLYVAVVFCVFEKLH